MTGGLTPSELAVLLLLAEGFSNKEIARHQATAVRTTVNVVSQILNKLGAQSRLEACLVAHASGVVNLDLTARRCADRLTAA